MDRRGTAASSSSSGGAPPQGTSSNNNYGHTTAGGGVGDRRRSSVGGNPQHNNNRINTTNGQNPPPPPTPHQQSPQQQGFISHPQAAYGHFQQQHNQHGYGQQHHGYGQQHHGYPQSSYPMPPPMPYAPPHHQQQQSANFYPSSAPPMMAAYGHSPHGGAANYSFGFATPAPYASIPVLQGSFQPSGSFFAAPPPPPQSTSSGHYGWTHQPQPLSRPPPPPPPPQSQQQQQQPNQQQHQSQQQRFHATQSPSALLVGPTPQTSSGERRPEQQQKRAPSVTNTNARGRGSAQQGIAADGDCVPAIRSAAATSTSSSSAHTAASPSAPPPSAAAAVAAPSATAPASAAAAQPSATHDHSHDGHDHHHHHHHHHHHSHANNNDAGGDEPFVIGCCPMIAVPSGGGRQNQSAHSPSGGNGQRGRGTRGIVRNDFVAVVAKGRGGGGRGHHHAAAGAGRGRGGAGIDGSAPSAAAGGFDSSNNALRGAFAPTCPSFGNDLLGRGGGDDSSDSDSSDKSVPPRALPPLLPPPSAAAVAGRQQKEKEKAASEVLLFEGTEAAIAASLSPSAADALPSSSSAAQPQPPQAPLAGGEAADDPSEYSALTPGCCPIIGGGGGAFSHTAAAASAAAAAPTAAITGRRQQRRPHTNDRHSRGDAPPPPPPPPPSQQQQPQRFHVPFNPCLPRGPTAAGGGGMLVDPNARNRNGAHAPPPPPHSSGRRPDAPLLKPMRKEVHPVRAAAMSATAAAAALCSTTTTAATAMATAPQQQQQQHSAAPPSLLTAEAVASVAAALSPTATTVKQQRHLSSNLSAVNSAASPNDSEVTSGGVAPRGGVPTDGWGGTLLAIRPTAATMSAGGVSEAEGAAANVSCSETVVEGLLDFAAWEREWRLSRGYRGRGGCPCPRGRGHVSSASVAASAPVPAASARGGGGGGWLRAYPLFGGGDGEVLACGDEPEEVEVGPANRGNQHRDCVAYVPPQQKRLMRRGAAAATAVAPPPHCTGECGAGDDGAAECSCVDDGVGSRVGTATVDAAGRAGAAYSHANIEDLTADFADLAAYERRTGMGTTTGKGWGMMGRRGEPFAAASCAAGHDAPNARRRRSGHAASATASSPSTATSDDDDDNDGDDASSASSYYQHGDRCRESETLQFNVEDKEDAFFTDPLLQSDAYSAAMDLYQRELETEELCGRRLLPFVNPPAATAAEEAAERARHGRRRGHRHGRPMVEWEVVRTRMARGDEDAADPCVSVAAAVPPPHPQQPPQDAANDDGSLPLLPLPAPTPQRQRPPRVCPCPRFGHTAVVVGDDGGNGATAKELLARRGVVSPFSPPIAAAVERERSLGMGLGPTAVSSSLSPSLSSSTSLSLLQREAAPPIVMLPAAAVDPTAELPPRQTVACCLHQRIGGVSRAVGMGGNGISGGYAPTLPVPLPAHMPPVMLLFGGRSDSKRQGDVWAFTVGEHPTTAAGATSTAVATSPLSPNGLASAFSAAAVPQLSGSSVIDADDLAFRHPRPHHEAMRQQHQRHQRHPVASASAPPLVSVPGLANGPGSESAAATVMLGGEGAFASASSFSGSSVPPGASGSGGTVGTWRLLKRGLPFALPPPTPSFAPGACPPPRCGHAAVASSKGTMVVFGGSIADDMCTNDCWEYAMTGFYGSGQGGVGDGSAPYPRHLITAPIIDGGGEVGFDVVGADADSADAEGGYSIGHWRLRTSQEAYESTVAAQRRAIADEYATLLADYQRHAAKAASSAAKGPAAAAAAAGAAPPPPPAAARTAVPPPPPPQSAVASNGINAGGFNAGCNSAHNAAATAAAAALQQFVAKHRNSMIGTGYPARRKGHTFTAVGRCHAVLIGGCDPCLRVGSTIPALSPLSPLAPMPTQTYTIASIAAANEDLTRTVWTLNFDTNRWRAVVPLGEGPRGRTYHVAAASCARRSVFVFGGVSVTNAQGTRFDNSTFFNDLHELVFGGCGEGGGGCGGKGGPSSSASAPPMWRRIETLGGPRPSPRMCSSIVVRGHSLVLFMGGAHELAKDSDAYYSLDTQTLRWRRLRFLSGHPPCSRPTTVLLGNKVLSFGGALDCHGGFSNTTYALSLGVPTLKALCREWLRARQPQAQPPASSSASDVEDAAGGGSGDALSGGACVRGPEGRAGRGARRRGPPPIAEEGSVPDHISHFLANGGCGGLRDDGADQTSDEDDDDGDEEEVEEEGGELALSDDDGAFTASDGDEEEDEGSAADEAEE